MTETTVYSTDVTTWRSVPSRVSGACCVEAMVSVRPREVETDQDEVDRLDSDEGNDDPAEPVDEHVLAQHRVGAARTIGDAAQGERDQRDDDQRVEDDRGEDRALARREPHHVERLHRRRS